MKVLMYSFYVIYTYLNNISTIIFLESILFFLILNNAYTEDTSFPTYNNKPFIFH